MKRLATAFVGLLAFGFANPACFAALSFSDGFEGPTLNPFWTVSESSGSINFPSTVQVHSGSQSVQFNSIDTGSFKDISLTHTFDAGIYGTFSVWMYDTGADQSSSNTIAMDLHGLGDRAQLVAFDFDLGPSNVGSKYNYTPSFVASFPTTVDRTLAWHNFLIETSPTFVRYSIDGQQVFQENQGLAVTTVFLEMSGPDGRPAWTTYFDDFSVQEAASPVPEPTSFLLFAGLGVGLCLTGGVVGRKEHATNAVG